MIQEIKDRIIALLGEIPGIKKILPYPDSSGSDGYPYIFVIWDNNTSEVLTNGSDKITISFKVVLVQEKMSSFKGPSAAERTSDDRTSLIENIFRDNNDLGITNVLRVLPVSSKKTYDTAGPRIIVESLIQVQAIAPVTV